MASIIPVVRGHCLILVKENSLISFFRIKKLQDQMSVVSIFLLKESSLDTLSMELLNCGIFLRSHSMKRDVRN